jgi:hypothetical protein
MRNLFALLMCACLVTPASAQNPLGGASTWSTAPPPTCAESIHYLARTSGGNEGGNATNIGTLICGLVQDGVITGDMITTGCGAPLDALYILAQQNATDALLNLCSSSFPATVVGAPTFTTFRGYSGFNSGSYALNTGFNAGTAPSPHFSSNSATIGIWANATAVDTAPQLATNNNTFLYDDYTGSLFFPRVNNGAGGSVPTPGTAGLFVGDRISSSTIVPYWDGHAQTSITSAVNTVDSHDFMIGGLGTATGTSQTLSEAHMGGALGATFNLALYNRLRTYMTAVGVP